MEDLLASLMEANVKWVRFLYCDQAGIIRGKSTHIDTLKNRFASGIGLTVAMQATNMLDQLQTIPGFSPVGEIRLLPDMSTLKVLPYAPRTASVLTNMMTLEQENWGACPRSFLLRMQQALSARGFQLQAAFENEFYLAEKTDVGYVPFDRTNCFSTIGMMLGQHFVDDLTSAFEAQGLALEQYYPELGHGQHEISLRHTDCVQAADQQILSRETIRNIAAAHGLYASFAAKPFADAAGSGAHLHFSLWDHNGKNLFFRDKDPYGLSTLGYQFMAGVLDHLPGLLAVLAPTVNSYRRLQPGSWSSAYKAWGPDNREAAVRVASRLWSDEEGSANLELKAVDNTTNPYLTLGCLIAAGLDGIDRQLKAPEPMLIDPATLSEAERQARHVERLPQTLEEALAALAADPYLLESMGHLLATSYLGVKQSEVEAFGRQDLAFELNEHFYRF